MKPKINPTSRGPMIDYIWIRIVFHFDGKMEGICVWYLLSRDVNVGITRGEDI